MIPFVRKCNKRPYRRQFSTDLSSKKCKPCEGNSQPLELSVSTALKKTLHASWEFADNSTKLTRTLKTKDFVSAMKIADKVKNIAEEEGHHPDIHLTQYNNLTVQFYTHSIGGLSENDFICAAKVDDLLEKETGTISLPKLTLYNFWRSSCSFRARMGLEFKGLPYTYVPVNLKEGENKSSEKFGIVNPGRTVPVLVVEEQGKQPFTVVQSPAILEFLEDRFSEHGADLLPKDPESRAKARMLSAIILDIQPLQNLSVLRKLFTNEQRVEKEEWAKNVNFDGLANFEKVLQTFHPTSTSNLKFCLGKSVSLADIYLVPQVYNGVDFGVDVKNNFPLIYSVYNNMLRQIPVLNAYPLAQPDSPRNSR